MASRLFVLSVDELAICAVDGKASLDSVYCLANLIVDLNRRDVSVAVVISGAGAFGRFEGRMLSGVAPAFRDHVLNAVGRPRLVEFLSRALLDAGLVAGVVTVSRSLMGDRRGHLAARETLQGLVRAGAIPIVWDDSPGVEGAGARYRYSDHISALIAGLLGGERVVFLNRTGGVRYVNGAELATAGQVSTVTFLEEFSSGEVLYRSPSKARLASLVSALQLMAGIGVSMHLVSLARSSATDILSGECGTLFTVDMGQRLSAIRRWLAVGAVPKGTLVVSPMAATTLVGVKRGSLLGAGVMKVKGEFRADDVVAVEDESGALLGYGIVRQGTRDLQGAVGKRDLVVVHADHYFGFPLLISEQSEQLE